MSTFNFGQTADFGAGANELVTAPGESGLFAPGELGSDLDFSLPDDNTAGGEGLIPESDPIIQEAAKPDKKVAPKAKPEEKPKAQEKPVKSAFDQELEEEEDDEEGEPGANKTGDEEDNVYKSYADDMFNAGIFTPLEGDDDLDFTDEEVLKSRFDRQIHFSANGMLNNFIGRLGTEHQKAFKDIFIGGHDPAVYYQKTSRIENLEKADLEDISTQERLVRSAMHRDGYDQEDIDQRVEKLKEYDDLAREAKLSHKKLVKTEQEELAENAKQNQLRLQHEAQAVQVYTANVNQVLAHALQEKNLGGLPVNMKSANDVYEMMTRKQWTINGKDMTEFERFLEDLKDPRNAEVAAKVALHYYNKFDTKPIEKKAISKENGKMFNAIKRKQNTQRRNSTIAEPTDNWTI